jgi:Prokaryotic phospholipase A2
MKGFILSVLGLATVVSAIPSQYEGDLTISRAVNSQCKAPEGSGSCQKTANCQGISYPAGFCPKDPTDVQCCVKITCKVPNVGTGFCRSVKNNGCSGGNFHAGHCPGSSDIKCCVKAAPQPSTGPKPTPPANPCTAAAYDKLMFQENIYTFMAAKTAKRPSCFDWTDDGCSWSPDRLGNYDFLNSCKRHDFGYRSAKKMGRFNAEMKKKVDSKLKDDLYDVCKKFSGWESYKGVNCRIAADSYVFMVRKYGKR